MFFVFLSFLKIVFKMVDLQLYRMRIGTFHGRCNSTAILVIEVCMILMLKLLIELVYWLSKIIKQASNASTRFSKGTYICHNRI